MESAQMFRIASCPPADYLKIKGGGKSLCGRGSLPQLIQLGLMYDGGEFPLSPIVLPDPSFSNNL